MFFWFFVLKRTFDYGSELFICLKEALVPELGKSPITNFFAIFFVQIGPVWIKVQFHLKHTETKIKDLYNTNFGHLFHTIRDKIFYIINIFFSTTN